MRGYLVCNSCGSNLTGSASKGNGGTYYYYHCQPGCKERHKADVLHHDFDAWLDSLTIKPEVAELYLAVMQDIFKTEEGDREQDIKKLQAEIVGNTNKLTKAAEKLVADELDKWGYNVLKENLSKRNTELRGKLQELKQTDSGFSQYLSYGLSLLSNLKHYYNEANLEGKQKFIGLIFPEKLIYSNGNYRTKEPNDIISLLCGRNADLKLIKSKKAGINSNLSCGVARRAL